jgi:hypothetical protein
MEEEKTGILFWKALFFALLPAYCVLYAPYGVNETDGGFITGLAWQVMNGKLLYQDIIYVRPPIPVLLRALELQLLPSTFSELGMRWIFYLEVWLSAYMGARLLARGNRMWLIAVFGFILSVHNYSPKSWHTTDGIFFAVLSAFLLSDEKRTWWRAMAAGTALFAALMCKQSFYPLAVAAIVVMATEETLTGRAKLAFFTGFCLAAIVFYSWLQYNGITDQYLAMTGGSASSGRALQHGLTDYFLITPGLAIPSMGIAGLLFYLFRSSRHDRALKLWGFWLCLLALSFAAVSLVKQEHIAPFAQSRVLFWIAAFALLLPLVRERRFQTIPFFLLAISWCASISWGYNLPVLYSIPLVWGVMEVTDQFSGNSGLKKYFFGYSIALAAILLTVFRIGYEFVYRDGLRTEMTEDMGVVFPQLTGIRSDTATASLYRDLKELDARYHGQYAVLPALPYASFLTGSTPPLPLDWVVNRETNGQNEKVYEKLADCRFILLEAGYLSQIPTNPELEVCRTVLETRDSTGRTAHFIIYKKRD